MPKSNLASGDSYDVWFPTLAPSAELLKQGQSTADDAAWRVFARRYRFEMAQTAALDAIALLAAMSGRANISCGCYCVDESRCNRSLLRDLLKQAGAELA